MRLARMALIVLCASSLQGCITAALAVGGLVAGAGVDHTLNGIVYKTFAEPVGEVRLATLKTLRRMDMQVTQDEKSEGGWAIKAEANERYIDVELEPVSSRTTRMRVVANKGDIFFKDSATATEIIAQTAESLQALQD